MTPKYIMILNYTPLQLVTNIPNPGPPKGFVNISANWLTDN